MKPTTRTHIGSICFCVCMIALLFVGWYVVYERMVTIGRRISVIVQTQTAQTTHQEQLQNLAASLQSAQSDIDTVNSHIIAPDGEVSFIEQIENLAKSENLTNKINTVGVSPAIDLSHAGLEYLNLQFTVGGTWSSIFQFVSALESMPYDVAVTQSDISDVSDGPSNASAEWQAAIQISVIKQQSPTEVQ